MLSRIIQGDTGDNIKGIEGIGEKRGQDLAKTYKHLNILLQALPIKGKSKYIANLNAGKDLLIRNQLLIDLATHTNEIIGFGDKGSGHLKTLEDLIKPFKEYPKVEVPQIEKKKEMTTMHLNTLEKAVDIS